MDSTAINTYNSSQITPIYGYLNPSVFNEAKDNIKWLEYTYKNEMKYNTLVNSLINVIKFKPIEEIGPPLFKTILAEEKKTDAEFESIYSEMMAAFTANPSEAVSYRTALRKACNDAINKKSLADANGDPVAFIELVKSAKYKVDNSESISTVNFGNLDMAELMSEYTEGGFSSQMQFINESFSPTNKYELGQLVMVCAPPGCFTGETEIRLCNNFSITFKELAEEFKSDKAKGVYYTYCKRSNGTIKKTEIISCWETKRTKDLLKLYFNNNTSVECTPEHLFYMSGDNKYKEAKDIKVGDLVHSLLSSRIVTKIETITLDNQIPVYDLEVADESHNFLLDCEVFVHNCGKTLFMMSECLHMLSKGARCHYIALGDMKTRDFVHRMGAIYSGLSFGDAKLRLESIYAGMKNLTGDRFGLSIVPAAKLSVDDYLEYVKTMINDYDVFFIDYDSNFLPTVASDNMYKEGGYLYDRLTELSGMNKLVFIASQPKIQHWKEESIPLEGVGESSRKQHNIDFLLTIGHYTKSPNHIGIMKIAKNRRGEVDITQPYIRLNNGRFKPISRPLYNTLQTVLDKRTYTEAEINMMLQNEASIVASSQKNKEAQ